MKKPIVDNDDKHPDLLKLQNIAKYFESGNYSVAPLVPGSPLVIESLETTMQLVMFSSPQCQKCGVLFHFDKEIANRQMAQHICNKWDVILFKTGIKKALFWLKTRLTRAYYRVWDSQD